jgi:hypothetical protein
MNADLVGVVNISAAGHAVIACGEPVRKIAEKLSMWRHLP